MKTANLKVFVDAFEFMLALRDRLKSNCLRANLRFIPNPLNGQIDIQPISSWFYALPPFAVSGNRRFYLYAAFEQTNGRDRVIVNASLSMMTNQLTVEVLRLDGSKKTVLIYETSTVSDGIVNQLGNELLDKIRKKLLSD
jgi:hypothetical protein